MNRDDADKGYNQEEAYFYKLNKELIERKRKELDSNQDLKADHNAQYWMRCPKCGNSLEEIDLMKIKVDKCTSCQGIYFDAGELEIVLESQEPTGFLAGIKKLINRSSP